ncbi:MAG: hypothetical protein KGJ57_09235 [Sphingomonadales bacterium]|nr:hypothetical protein [Sphingomonadales bacterium]MDE2169593.1 hypothetical protein [Sphingomonadales bacterium]
MAVRQEGWLENHRFGWDVTFGEGWLNACKVPVMVIPPAGWGAMNEPHLGLFADPKATFWQVGSFG